MPKKSKLCPECKNPKNKKFYKNQRKCAECCKAAARANYYKKRTTPKTQSRKQKREKLSALNVEKHPRTRREYLDFDYVDQLTPQEKKFMAKFIDEYYGAALAKKEDKYGRSKDLHRTLKDRKQCTDRNNARLRDLTTLSKVGGVVDPLDTATHVPQTMTHEDNLVQIIDLKNSAIKKAEREARYKVSKKK